MEILLTRKHAEYLKKTYPGMTVDQALNAFLQDTMNDTELLNQASVRRGHIDWIAGLLIIAVIILLAVVLR